PVGHGVEAGNKLFHLGGFSDDCPGAALQEAQSLGFGYGNAPDDDGRGMFDSLKTEQPVEHRLHSKSLVDQKDIHLAVFGDAPSFFERVNRMRKTQVPGFVEEGFQALDSNRLSIADPYGF